VGTGAGSGVTTASDVLCIGAAGANVDSSCYIRNVWQQPGGSQAVYVNSEGKLGAQVSSRRFKEEIEPMEQASEVIYRLKPVSFRYKPEIEPARPLGFGLIAEDVEQVSPDLVACDKEGRPYSVRYDQVNAMLLNEFLKEHRKVEDQQAAIAELRSVVARQQTEFRAAIAKQRTEMQNVVARLERQDAEIQRVNDRIEMTKTAHQTVANNE
jgi:hypothetical protein